MKLNCLLLCGSLTIAFAGAAAPAQASRRPHAEARLQRPTISFSSRRYSVN